MIKNAKDVSLDIRAGAVPDMSGALNNWLQPMVFVKVSQSNQNFEVTETNNPVNFQGTWQPMSKEKLKILPEGQRSWKWFTVHSTTELPLKTNDKIRYQNVKYRIMDKGDYSLYGFFEYDLVDDYDATNC
jgi:hypothetical protein